MTPSEFEKYKHEAAHESLRLNELCNRQFRISEWPRWDYELDDGTLTFSQEGTPRVIADILVAGSTSKSGGTWLWSWANESLPALVTEPMNRVREFGEREGIEALAREMHPDDEYLGWAMTAIAVRIMNAKGSYRCPTENGFVYVIYMELSHAEQPRVQKEWTRIRCDEHPIAYSTYVCAHLINRPTQEWFGDEPSEEKGWPDAWCSKCNKQFEKEGEWNDKNMSKVDIRLVCHLCYERLRGSSTPQ